MQDEPWEIEQKGYERGTNPLLGRFSRTFNFDPVPYGSSQRNNFKEQLKKDLIDINYVYFGEVKLEIILYLNEQKRYETPDLADLDNYAKLICDSLKGSDGIFIDDCQIQSLNISWIDTTKKGYFEINISGHPDEYLMKPLKMYEMENSLYYPLSDKIWTTEGIIEEPIDTELLNILNKMVSNSKKRRHYLRMEGIEQNRAYFLSRYLAPILTGFHKNRVIDSGFELVELENWKENNFV
ncbi:RusA family crossover junction endodeoxyribonuclease [Paenibacillus residui]|uniref:RusA family crossover junction endodeoxyribonuclease n=1 Tax=Paenibacillus residui TaxID=629724 RepID=A0ABW3DE43_9BACL